MSHMTLYSLKTEFYSVVVDNCHNMSFSKRSVHLVSANHFIQQRQGMLKSQENHLLRAYAYCFLSLIGKLCSLAGYPQANINSYINNSSENNRKSYSLSGRGT